MKIRYYYILLSLCLFSCVEQTRNKQISKFEVRVNDNSDKKKSFWINSNYVECLKQNLPCDCIDEIEYFIIAFNPELSTNLSVCEINQTTEVLFAKSNGNLQYDVYFSEKETKSFFQIEIVGDTLLLNKDGNVVKYNLWSNYVEFNNGQELLSHVNFNSLIKQLPLNEIEFRKILEIKDSIMFLCNKEIGNINLFSNYSSCKNQFILEQSNDTIHIYKYINSCDGKTYPIVINKELFVSIKQQ